MTRDSRTQLPLALVVAFDSTASALAFATEAKRTSLDGRLIPVPRSLSAGCGIAWRSTPDTRPAAQSTIDRLGIDDARLVEMPLR